MKIAEFLLRTLEANGVRHIFGNPGTTEIPLVRACEKRRKLKYVVALSEVAAVPMANGYARARRSKSLSKLNTRQPRSRAVATASASTKSTLQSRNRTSAARNIARFSWLMPR